MQWSIVAVWGSIVLWAIRRMRRCGDAKAARRWYRRTAFVMGIGVWCAMLVQEWTLWRSGLLSWATGLPLHLCSAMGVMTLPMLLSGSRFLWHAALYAGMTGAAMALMFPAVADTDFPQLTQAAFYTMHALILWSPLLPLGLGRQPRPSGAMQAWLFLVLLGVAAMAVNRTCGGNYLFLAWAIPGTPLMLLAQGGVWAYRTKLAVGAAMILTVEGICVLWLQRRHVKPL